MGQVDLHLHTTASDGGLSPRELVALAFERGLRYIAVTDHDTTAGVEEALAAAKDFPGLTVIPGIEISTDIPHAEVHILGYFLDYRDPDLQDTLSTLRGSRIGRAQKMIAKLAELGIRIEWRRVLELAGDGSVGRPHIAQAMLEKGYIPSTREAFTRYIGRDGPAYAERYKLTPEEAVQLVVDKKGLPVLAHPAEHPSIRELLPGLIEAGLVGLEAYYGGYSQQVVGELVALAGAYGLIVCGGSDFHGLGSDVGVVLGSVEVPLEHVQRLMEMASARGVLTSRPGR